MNVLTVVILWHILSPLVFFTVQLQWFWPLQFPASLVPWHFSTSRRTWYFCYEEYGHKDQPSYLCPWINSTWGKSYVLLNNVLEHNSEASSTEKKHPKVGERHASWTLFIWIVELHKNCYWYDAADMWQSTEWTFFRKSAPSTLKSSLFSYYSLTRPYF